MGIRRIVPNIKSGHVDESRAFYEDIVGMHVAMNLDWVLTLASPSNPTAQLTLIPGPEPSGTHPDVSIEVDDVDSIYKRAIAAGIKIVYTLTEEAWGVKRFFMVDPDGWVVNVVSHIHRE